MNESTDPSRTAPLRRLAFLGLVFVAAILSCGKDVTGPLGAAARYVRGLAFEPVFPPAFQLAGGSASGLVQFSKVHVVLHHSDGTVALDTTIDYPADSSSVTLALTVKLLDGAPATGEPMNLDLDYVNSTGQTVFHGGPVAITAAPPPAGGGSNPPVQVPVTYTGPGATATAVVISPRTIARVAGQSFAFSANAVDASGATLANTPIIWNSLDPSIAAITATNAGAGIAGSVRGTARITAQLLTGQLDQVTVVVTLPAASLSAQGGSGQTGVVGTSLAAPLVVKVSASDGVGVAGYPVSFAVASGGGSVGSSSVVSDANGIASTSWKLGTTVGAQSVTASAAGLTGSPISFGATATAATATQLVITGQPSSGAAGSAPGGVVVTAEDANGNIATTFTGGVSLGFGTNTTGASLGGATSVNAGAGVAAFSGLTVTKTGTGYTLVASSTGLTSATTGAFDITPGAPSKLVFTGQPSSANVNSPIGTIVVAAQDAQGNATPTFTGSVSLGLASNPGHAALGGATSGSAVAGVATFTGVTVSAPGTGYALSAAASGLTSATSGAFNITGGVATTITLMSGGGQTGAPSAALAQPIVIKVADALGNGIAGTQVNFAVVTGGGSVSPTIGISDATGLVQTVWTLGATLGAQSITATAGTLTNSPITINATAAVAGAKTWTGATSTAWAVATNWSPAGVPVAGDSAFIPSGGNQPTISAAVTIKSLTIAAGALLSFTGSPTVTLTGSLTDNGGMAGPGNMVLSGTGTLAGGNSPNLTVSGTYSLAGAANTVGTTIVTGSLNLNGHALGIAVGSFTTSGAGTITMANAADALSVSGNATFAGGASTLTNGALVVTGAFAQTTTANAFNAIAPHSTVLSGTVAQTVNFANPGASGFGNVTFANSAGVMLQTNVLANNVTAAIGAVSGPTIGMTITGTLTDPSTLVSIAAFSFVTSATPVSATTPAITTSGGGVTFNGIAQLAGNLTINAGVNVNSASGSISANGHTLTINGNFATQNSGVLAMSGASDVVIINGNATFAGGAGALTNGVLQITGNFTQTTAATAFAASSPHITRFTGATPTISFANPTTSNFGTLQLQTSGAVTFATNAATSFDIWLKTGTTPSVTGAVTVTAGRAIYDSTGGRWQVANTVMAGSGTLPKFITTNLAFTAAVILVDSVHVTGSVASTGASAALDLNGFKMIVSGNFSTSAGGVFKMSHVSDSLIVNGNASFNGGSTAGLLTNGLFEFNGASFTQATNAAAFAATSSHVTYFWGSQPQTITFANPAAGSSHFGILYLGDTSTVFGSDVIATGQFQTGIVISHEVRSTGADHLLTSDGANMRNTRFVNVRWKVAGVNGNGSFPSIDNVFFDSTLTTAAQFEFNYSTTTNLFLSGFSFATQPTTGSYIKVVGPDTLTMGSVSPTLNGGFLNLSGFGAVSGWSNTTTWTGGLSTSWNTAGNWSFGVPNASMDIVINSGSFQPNTGGPVTMHNLTVNSGATLTVSGASGQNTTINGDITVAPGGQLNLPSSNVGLIAYGNVTTDTAGTTGITGCNGATSPNLNLQAGTHNITGKFCNVANFGTYTATGPIQVVGSGSYGAWQNGNGGSLNVNGNRIDTYAFFNGGTGTIQMTNPADLLYVHGGTANFNGGSETGLMTQGTIYLRGATLSATGTGFDASGGSQMLVVDTAFVQTLSWTAAVPGHGFNNVTMKGTQSKQFSGDQWITGTLLFDVSMTSIFGTVSGSYNIHVGSLVDNSTITGGAFNGSTQLHMTGNGTFLHDTLRVHTVEFDGGGSFTLTHNLLTFNVVVDSGSSLILNGHHIDTQSNNFITQNGGAINMTAVGDSIIALAYYFNGGNTAGSLTTGGIAVSGSTYSYFYQGYDATHTAVPGTSATSFAATGTRVWLAPSFGTNVAFLNPNTGAAGSHFGFVQAKNANPVALLSDVFVDSLFMAELVGGATWTSDSPGTVVRTVTTKGLYNSGTYNLALQGVGMVWNDGADQSAVFSNVTWTSFPASYTGTLLTTNRSSPALQVHNNNFTAITLSGSGKFINNIGTIAVQIVTNPGLTGALGACSAGGLLLSGQACP